MANPRFGSIVITRQVFEAFERVRIGGQTNMMDASRVIQLSGGAIADRNTVASIIENYDHLYKLYSP